MVHSDLFRGLGLLSPLSPLDPDEFRQSEALPWAGGLNRWDRRDLAAADVTTPIVNSSPIANLHGNWQVRVEIAHFKLAVSSSTCYKMVALRLDYLITCRIHTIPTDRLSTHCPLSY